MKCIELGPVSRELRYNALKLILFTKFLRDAFKQALSSNNSMLYTKIRQPLRMF